MNTTADLIIKFRWLIIAGFIAVTIIFALQIRNAEINADMKSQLKLHISMEPVISSSAGFLNTPRSISPREKAANAGMAKARTVCQPSSCFPQYMKTTINGTKRIRPNILSR